MSKTLFLTDEIFLKHKTSQGHPENPERILCIYRKLKQSPLWNQLIKLNTQPASTKWIETVHDKNYIDKIKQYSEQGLRPSDPDTIIDHDTYEVALNAVGGCLKAVDYIMQGKANNGFCAIRPPGHHAEKHYSMGYCIFNNIAITVKYLQQKYNLKRIAIVDWDVHHGNGTQSAFENDESVCVIDLHEHPLYPGTGQSSNKNIYNILMKPMSREQDYLQEFSYKVSTIIQKFKPEFILVSAGYDAHVKDTISTARLTAESYGKFTHILKTLANKYCGGRLLLILEGGYNLQGLAKCVEKSIEGLIR